MGRQELFAWLSGRVSRNDVTAVPVALVRSPIAELAGQGTLPRPWVERGR